MTEECHESGTETSRGPKGPSFCTSVPWRSEAYSQEYSGPTRNVPQCGNIRLWVCRVGGSPSQGLVWSRAGLVRGLSSQGLV